MKNKIITIVSHSLALIVLLVALVYYNFFDKAVAEMAMVGSRCTDFTVTRIVDDGESFSVSEETYTFSKNQGKVRVINLWATWCSACVAELPEFDELAKEYKNIDVLALTDASCGSLSGVMAWLATKGWKANDPYGEWLGREYIIGFGDSKQLLTELGSTGTLPVTIIVDQKGEIVYKKKASVTYEELKTVVDSLLANA